MPITIVEELEDTKRKEKVPTNCPSEQTHTWDDNYCLGSICLCNTWQVVELIDYQSFWAIDFTGRRQIFDRA